MCHNRRIDLRSAKNVGSSHLERPRSARGQDLERSPEKVVDRNRVLRSEISKRSHNFERGHLKKQSRYTPLYTKISLWEICVGIIGASAVVRQKKSRFVTSREAARSARLVKISRDHLKKLWIEIEFRGRDLKVVAESCGSKSPTSPI